MKKFKKNTCITIVGKEWSDSFNKYTSIDVYKNNSFLFSMKADIRKDYDHRAIEKLHKLGYVKSPYFHSLTDHKILCVVKTVKKCQLSEDYYPYERG